MRCPAISTSISDQAVIAIDGGGTRCRLAMQFGGDRHQVEVGSANVATDFDGSLQQITRGLEKLADLAGLALEDVHALPVYAALAGATDDDLNAALAARLPCKTLVIDDDRPAAVRGALGASDGAIAHCGTGSFQAIQREGRIRIVGGWGPVLGDEASAMWLGREVLSATLDASDGITAMTGLTETLLRRFETPEAVESFGIRATPAEMGAFAPYVTAAAEEHDATARDIMSRGAARIARVVRALGWTPDLPIMLTGGLAGCYGPYLDAAMQNALRAPDADPIDGALALAREFAERLGA